ncbi:MAG: polymerase subunit sigma-70, partial [Paenibacillaceae bacterium]|nr:polymerase subunit sigma-70 [Paenibacillaceae bacterium]
MSYTLMFYESQDDFAARMDPARQQQYLAGWKHYVHALRQSGVVVFGSGLHAPETAATMKRRGGEMVVQDGPFPETKEQLGGICSRAGRYGRGQTKHTCVEVIILMETNEVIEQTARDAYGRLLSYLAVNWRDLQAVEDAIGDAFLAALETWPKIGIPNKPEAWLVTAARRRLIDRARRTRISENALPALLAMSEDTQRLASSSDAFPDERLKMMFLCTHPEIDPVMRTPLMLQTVLGIDAARIASAFIIKPSTMSQRLTRVKAKIRAERLTFEMPNAEEISDRLDSVLEAIYAAYGSGWDEAAIADSPRKKLAEEAIYLGRLLLQFAPHEPEVNGLLVLMLHCEARREARHDEEGNYIPLSEQDCARWEQRLILEAEHYLHIASQGSGIGRFQLMAAIQSVHAQRLWNGHTEWEAIAQLYEGLIR